MCLSEKVWTLAWTVEDEPWTTSFFERLWRSFKYEDLYLKGYSNMAELTLGLKEYFAFYNNERPHQSLGYQTTAAVYRTGHGGGASIPDHFKDRRCDSPGERSEKGESH
jgi:putative transposase